MNKKIKKTIIFLMVFGVGVVISHYIKLNYTYQTIINKSGYVGSVITSQKQLYNNILIELKTLPEFNDYNVFKKNINEGDIIGRQDIYVENKTIEKYSLYLFKNGTTKMGNFIIDPKKDFFIGEAVSNLKSKKALVLKGEEIYYLER